MCLLIIHRLIHVCPVNQETHNSFFYFKFYNNSVQRKKKPKRKGKKKTITNVPPSQRVELVSQPFEFIVKFRQRSV